MTGGWSAQFYDADGEPTSRGWSSESLTDLVRRVMLRFEHTDARHATLATRGRQFALISVAAPFEATVASTALDDRSLTDRERRALSHVEKMLRVGVRVHRAPGRREWRSPRVRPEPR